MAVISADMHALVTRLFPLPRSLTGDGVRDTLGVLAEHLPVEVTEVPSGTDVLDWTVPREWVVKDAWVRDPTGRTVVSLADGPLTLVGHSAPFSGRLPLEELRPHLHSLPDRPRAVPYRTTYYAEDWGFCLPHEVVLGLRDGEYEVCVDTALVDGSLTYGEVVVPGGTDDELLLSAHVCHPAQANDNLSGIAVAAAVAERLLARPRPLAHTVRVLFAPGTLGAIAWLHREREGAVRRLRGGMVLTGLGDAAVPCWKRSRAGTSTVDRAVEHVLRHTRPDSRLIDFSPYGYDERQFCSPGFDLPVGRLTRGAHGEYPEYHTSADDLDFVAEDRMQESLGIVEDVLQVLDADRVLRSTAPYGEPQLGRRGLYRSTGATIIDAKAAEMALLWVLNLCDGTRSLLDVARRADLPFSAVATAADRLLEAGLLEPAQPRGQGGR